MRINNILVENPKEEKTLIYRCPYCLKKFLSKQSYRNHIAKNFCPSFFIDFEKQKKRYESSAITKKQFYEWCYENGYIEFLDLKKVTIKDLGEEFYYKIINLYDGEYE